MNAPVLLEVKNLKKSFMSGTGRKQNAQEAVKGISFSVAAGECAGLVGPSGCGKSTVARLVTGLIPPDEGSIFFRGQEIFGRGVRCGKDVYQDMQMVFQSPADSFDPRQTLGWSIGEGMRNLGWERSRITERTERLLIEVGLNASYGRRYPHEVSGGEAQRAAIARALALEPKLLICDEVTSALDVTIQAQVIGVLRKIISGKELSCLLHN